MFPSIICDMKTTLIYDMKDIVFIS